MTQDSVNFSFIGGVLAPEMTFRPDLDKYAYGLKSATNWLVSKNGSLLTRPPTIFCELVQNNETPVFVPYESSEAPGQSFLVIITATRIRFIQNGNYVIDANKTVTTSAGSVLTIPAHDYAIGDLLVSRDAAYFGTPYFEITGTTLNTVTLISALGHTLEFANNIATVALVTTLVSPITHLKNTRFAQYRETLRITNKINGMFEIIRSSVGVWSIAPGFTLSTSNGPASVTTVSSVVGTAGAAYAVTAVDRDGNESRPSPISALLTGVNPAITATTLTTTFPAVTGALYYNVYRTQFLDDATKLNGGMEFGFLGRTYGNSFLEKNIIPDYKSSLPFYENPFFPGRLVTINVTSPGAGYTQFPTISITDPTGVGFKGYIVTNAGTIVGIRILDTGYNYTNPTVVISGAGAGAVFSVIRTSATGFFPQALARHKQRHLFGGATDYPNRINGTRVDDKLNFRQSFFASPGDPLNFDLDGEKLVYIQHFVPMPTGLFIFSRNEVLQLRGQNNEALDATNPDADTIVQTGTGDLRPLKVDREVLYVTIGQDSVVNLSPSNLPTYYVDKSLSAFSSHYFSATNPVISWSYAYSTTNVIWFVRDDGTMLSLTYNAAQEIVAFSDHETDGKFLVVETVQEDTVPITYVAVERFYASGPKLFIERLGSGRVSSREDQQFVDSSLSYLPTKKTNRILINQTTAIIEATTDTTGMIVGDVIRVGEDRYKILTVAVGFLTLEKEFGPVKPTADRIKNWSIGRNVSIIRGLWHLEGRIVEGLANGIQFELTVTNGAITLLQPASLIHIGLAYRGEFETLPLSSSNYVLQNKRKRVTEVALRSEKSKGLAIGDQVDRLYPTKETNINAGQPSNYLPAYYHQPIGAIWGDEGSIVVQKNGPYGANIFGAVVAFETGDVDS